MKNNRKSVLAVFLVLALLLPSVLPAFSRSYAAELAPTLAKLSVSVKTGAKKIVKINNLPAGAKVSWKSSRKSVAKVKKTKNNNGKVIGKKKGSANITCRITTKDNKVYSLSCAVKVKKASASTTATTPNPAVAVKINNAAADTTNNAYTITVGQSFTFKADVTAKDTTKTCTDSVFFAVANPELASVSDGGSLTALKPGTTTLTVYAGKTKTEALAGSVKETLPICVKSKEIKVQSVSLAYSTRLVVTFDQPVKADSIFDPASKKIHAGAVSIIGKNVNGTDAKTVGTLTGSLSEDKKTLFVDNSNDFKGTYTVVLTDQIKSEGGTALTTYSEEQKLVDDMGPSYEGTTMDESGMICTIRFNEPVNISKLSLLNAVKANGNPIFGGTTELLKVSSYKLSEDKKSLTIDLSFLISSDQNCEIKVDMYGLMDLSGNASRQYPQTVTLCTNTANKVEAKCTQVYRNGKSLVAVFDQSLCTAGYITVNGMTLPGIVNPDNKKVGIYYLQEGGLQSLSGQQEVTVNGFSVFNNYTTNNVYKTTANFSMAAIAPEVQGTKFITKTKAGVRKNVLEITFDKTVNLNQTSGNITANVVADGTIGSSGSYSYTAEVNGKVVSMTLSGSFIGGSTYNFSLPAGFVTDYYHNDNNAKTISAKKDSGDAVALPGPVQIQLSSSNKKIVYVTFNTMVDMTSAQTVANYSISGLTITNATVVANSAGSPAIVELTLSNELTSLGVPYQVTVRNICGYKGEYAAMADYKEMITLGQNQTLEIIDRVVYSGDNKVILSFNNNLNSGSRVSYQFTGTNNKNYTLKEKPAIKDNTITFVFNETFVVGQSIVMVPATDNHIYDANNTSMLNVPVTVTIY